VVVVFLLKFAMPFDTLQTPVECAVFSLWQYLQISSAWIVTGMHAVEIYEGIALQRFEWRRITAPSRTIIEPQGCCHQAQADDFAK